MSGVPVLMYHHVAPDREVTPEGFDRQMAWLKQEGFTTLTCDGLRAHLLGETPAPEKAVVITFDDGYADNWVHAFPVLRKYGLKATLFVVTGRMVNARASRPTSEEGARLDDTRTAERVPEGFLYWPELKAMADSGLVEIGSHTHSHRDFVRAAGYKDLREELDRSKAEIELHLGRWCGALAWPWGDFEKDWLRLLKPSGYRTAFTVQVGPNMPGIDPYRALRFKVQNGDASWLAARIWMYRHPIMGKAYASLYGLDRKAKNLFK